MTKLGFILMLSLMASAKNFDESLIILFTASIFGIISEVTKLV